MRVAIVDTYYPLFLAAHYESKPGLARRTYDEQLAALMACCFGTSDAYSWHLQELGHEAAELVVNCYELQRQWALEHGHARFSRRLAPLPSLPGRAGRRRLLHEVAFAQIELFEPEVVYIQDLSFFSRYELDALRDRGCLVVGQIASAPPELSVLCGYDLITTSFPHFVSRFRDLGVDSEYFRIGFYEHVLDRVRARGIEPTPAAERGVAVSFIGGVNPTIHGQRVRLLERVTRDLPFEIWGWGLEALPSLSPIHARHRGEAWGLDMYEVLARSRLTINRHIDVAEGHANNMRLFEATGVGALLLTEEADNLSSLFAPGEEVVAYTSEDELVEKIRHYVERDDERLAIATAGQKRTLTDHTYRLRMRELADLLAERVV